MAQGTQAKLEVLYKLFSPFVMEKIRPAFTQALLQAPTEDEVKNAASGFAALALIGETIEKGSLTETQQEERNDLRIKKS